MRAFQSVFVLMLVLCSAFHRRPQKLLVPIFRLLNGNGINGDNNGNNLSGENFENMKLPELRDACRALGGSPGALRKVELLEKCKVLLAATTSTNHTSVAPNPTTGTTPPTDIIKQSPSRLPKKLHAVAVDGVYNATFEVLAEMAVTNKSLPQGLEEPTMLPKYRFPYGSSREHRLDKLKAVYSSMDVTFLGTASCIPSITRGVNCIALRYNADSWLFDCGEATQIQIQKSKIKPSRVRKIFITHLHGDHSFGLPGLLCLIGQATQLERGQDAPPLVEVYGPEGTRDMVRAMIQLTYSRITVPHVIHELKAIPFLHGRFAKQPPPPMVRTRFDPIYGEVEGSRDIFPDSRGFYHLFEDEERIVMAAAMQHTVPCVGYVVKEKDRAGRLRLETVKHIVDRNFQQLRTTFPNPLKVYGKLKSLSAGENFMFPDGTAVSAEQVLDPPKRGRKVVILGDTCSAEMIAPLCTDADLIVHEATNAFLKELDGGRYPEYKYLERDTYVHGHSTPQMAGRFTRSVGGKRLVLTHFSPRYRGDDSEYAMKIMWQVEDMARQTSGLQGENDVIAAWDLMVVPVSGDRDDEAVVPEAEEEEVEIISPDN